MANATATMIPAEAPAAAKLFVVADAAIKTHATILGTVSANSLGLATGCGLSTVWGLAGEK